MKSESYESASLHLRFLYEIYSICLSIYQLRKLQRRRTADAIRLFDQQFWFVYILELSEKKIYTGYTQDVSERLARHQNGMVPYTASHRPVKLVFYCGFPDKYRAIKFEKYLKSGSGRAFMNKRLIERK